MEGCPRQLCLARCGDGLQTSYLSQQKQHQIKLVVHSYISTYCPARSRSRFLINASDNPIVLYNLYNPMLQVAERYRRRRFSLFSTYLSPRFHQREHVINHTNSNVHTIHVSPHFENTIFELFHSTHSPVIFSECNQSIALLNDISLNGFACSHKYSLQYLLYASLIIVHCWPQSVGK